MALKRALTGAGPVVVLEVADDLSEERPEQVELRVRLDQWARGDEVRVRWDGVEQRRLETRYCAVGDPHRISDVSGAAWLCCALSPEQAATGPHRVEVILDARNPHVACDVTLTDVELVIRYSRTERAKL